VGVGVEEWGKQLPQQKLNGQKTNTQLSVSLSNSLKMDIKSERIKKILATTVALTDTGHCIHQP
jgi:hypothetical protein